MRENTGRMNNLSKEEAFDLGYILRKYNLGEKEKARELERYLLREKIIKLSEFSTLFNIEKEDADRLLTLILKALSIK